MNPYSIRTFFTLPEAACAVAGFVGWTLENKAACQAAFDELVHSAKTGELPADKVARFASRQVRTWDGWQTVEEPAGTNWAKSRISRADLLAWCESRNIRPPLLFTEKPLHQSERRTLLNIIRALAELSGINPIKTRATGDGWRKAAEALLKELADKGITPPCKEAQTLAEKLREAFSLRE